MHEGSMSHVYKPGQFVRTKGRNPDRSRGIYEVVRLMPAGPDGVRQYRVQGQEGERVLHENEIENATDSQDRQ